MRSISKRYPVLLIAAVLAAGLSGCGGSSGTRTDSDTGMTGDTDTGMTGDGQTLTVPEGLVRSTIPPLFYTDDDDEPDSFIFPALASGIHRDYDEQRSGLANDAYVKSLGFSNVDDEADAFDLRVIYVVGDEEVTVDFTADDRDTPDVEESWAKIVDGVEYWGWLWDPRDDDDTTSFLGGISQGTGRPGYRLYGTAGFRTPIADLPTGTAVYVGQMRGDTHHVNDPSPLGGRERINGSLRLTADFDEGSIEGRISDIAVRGEGERVDLPNSTYFAIDDGQIVDGQFTASLTGMDSNANAPMNETVRGYEGGVLGEFHGPDAETVGGVLNASREDRVMAGVFAGHKQ